MGYEEELIAPYCPCPSDEEQATMLTKSHVAECQAATLTRADAHLQQGLHNNVQMLDTFIRSVYTGAGLEPKDE
jgi:hypothetical protein